MNDVMKQPVNMRKKRGLFEKRTVLLLGWMTFLCVACTSFLYFQLHGLQQKRQQYEYLRGTGNRLRGAGLNEQAADIFSRYLEQGSLKASKRARLAYTIGKLYYDFGQYEKALTYLYMAEESSPPKDLRADISSKVVTALENLKKLGAARYALKSRSSLNKDEQIKRGGKVIAKVGNDTFTVSDVEQALEALPPQLAQKFKTAKQKVEFAKNYVAEEMLKRRAVRMGLDKDPEVRKHMAMMMRQLLVQKLLQKEMASKGEIDEQDVKNYYSAHKENYAVKDGKKQKIPPYEEIKQQVQQDYAAQKVQAVYGQLLEDAIKVEQVEFFPQAMLDNAGKQ